MREALEQLSDDIDRIDSDNIYQALEEIKAKMKTLVELIDEALPKDAQQGAFVCK